MARWLKETQGETLVGSIDGANRDYVVTNDLVGQVNVFHNGLLLVDHLDDGYEVVQPRTIRMKEAPLANDTLEIEYELFGGTGGGADGGVPPPATILDNERRLTASETLPRTFTEEMVPVNHTRKTLVPQVSVTNLRPVILPNEPEDPCP